MGSEKVLQTAFLKVSCSGHEGSEKDSEQGSQKGSEKNGPSRRHLEGRNTPFREYHPFACALHNGLGVQ